MKTILSLTLIAIVVNLVKVNAKNNPFDDQLIKASIEGNLDNINLAL